jgi:putative membrane protein
MMRHAGGNIIIGVIAGLAASLAMNRFQSLWAKAIPMPDGATAGQKAADALSKEVSGKPVRASRKDAADDLMHYATGAVLGGLYGLVVGIVPAIALGRGLVYGCAVWLLADELAVPALKLSRPPSKVAAREHALGFASHAVFGLTLDAVRRRFMRADPA